MAYASKYYDPVKAHEYYMKHRKLKGRRKRGSTAGLSEIGKAAAAEVKEQLQAELKAALAKLPKKGATEARKKLREEYNEKYYAELDKMRQDPGMLQQKATRASSGGSSRSSGGSSRSSSGGSARSSSAAATRAKTKAKTKSRADLATQTLNRIRGLTAALNALPEEQQVQMQDRVDELISKAAKKLSKDLKAMGGGKVKQKKMGADATARAMNTLNKLVSMYSNLPEETRAKLQSQIQGVVNRISKKLGTSTIDVEEVGMQVDAEKAAKAAEKAAKAAAKAEKEAAKKKRANAKSGASYV